jgi:hypothetical protein
LPNAFRSSRRVILLGVVISLAFLGLSLVRPVSKAQEQARTTDRKALREQIMALHAEIDLMEVEQGVDRQTLADLMKQERTTVAQIELAMQECIHGKVDENLDKKIDVMAGEVWFCLTAEGRIGDEELRKQLSEKEKEMDDYVLKSFGKGFADELNALAKIEKKEEFSEARRRLVDLAGEHILKKATEGVRRKTSLFKKEFTRRSAKLAGKKLDLETLERQYREAR